MIVASMHLNQSNPAALRPLRDFNFQVWQSLGLTLPLDLGPSCDFNLNCLPSAFGAPWHGYCSPAANSGWESCCDTLGDNLTCPAASKDCFFGLVFFYVVSYAVSYVVFGCFRLPPERFRTVRRMNGSEVSPLKKA